jgi:Tfp pilus assembly protein PilO
MGGRRIPRGTAVAMIVAGDLVLLVLGWFMLVSPQRATAKSNATAAQATEVQVQQASAPASNPSVVIKQPPQPEIRTAYLYKLSKAMPMTTDMPNLLLELSQVVRSTGVDLSSIAPTPPDASGVSAITLAVSGDFYSVTDLLYRLRSLVAVHDGALDVAGRLFTIKSVGLTPTGDGRELNASIQLNAFTFGTASAAAATAPAPAAPTGTSTGETTTTSDTTSSSAADVAIGP